MSVSQLSLLALPSPGEFSREEGSGGGKGGGRESGRLVISVHSVASLKRSSSQTWIQHC